MKESGIRRSFLPRPRSVSTRRKTSWRRDPAQRLSSPVDSTTAEKSVIDVPSESADVPEAGIDDVVEDGSEGIAEAETDFVLVAGRRPALAAENLAGRRRSAAQRQLTASPRAAREELERKSFEQPDVALGKALEPILVRSIEIVSQLERAGGRPPRLTQRDRRVQLV